MTSACPGSAAAQIRSATSTATAGVDAHPGNDLVAKTDERHRRAHRVRGRVEGGNDTFALRGCEALAGRLAEQADDLEAERDAYARLSVRYERARIAAELHDVVAHAISVMVVQASAGQRLAVREPARAAETFDVIATAARQAQADLDRLADLLAPDASPDGGADLGLVRELVDTAAASGLPVTLRVSGDTSGVSGAVAHAALRVVQEGLTNALRYAPGAAVEVAVEARRVRSSSRSSTADRQLRPAWNSVRDAD